MFARAQKLESPRSADTGCGPASSDRRPRRLAATAPCGVLDPLGSLAVRRRASTVNARASPQASASGGRPRCPPRPPMPTSAPSMRPPASVQVAVSSTKRSWPVTAGCPTSLGSRRREGLLRTRRDREPSHGRSPRGSSAWRQQPIVVVGHGPSARLRTESGCTADGRPAAPGRARRCRRPTPGRRRPTPAWMSRPERAGDLVGEEPTSVRPSMRRTTSPTRWPNVWACSHATSRAGSRVHRGQRRSSAPSRSAARRAPTPARRCGSAGGGSGGGRRRARGQTDTTRSSSATAPWSTRRSSALR